MRNVLSKICRENQNTHFSENRAVYEKTSKYIEEPEATKATQYGANALHAG
jgi:hypothetical protein